MPSPFPGMDPFLEGYLWPDVHHRLATEFTRRLGPQLRPKYVARLEITVVEDVYPEVEVGLMYPDVEIVRSSQSSVLPESSSGQVTSEAEELTAPLTLPLLKPVPVKVASVEVRDVAQNQLVTSIEILSPVNKREPGLGKYREKQRRLREADVHVLEIDLLRRGIRPLQHPRLPDSAYLVTLIRAQSGAAELWPIQLSDALPLVPVPLRQPDPDVRLELGLALQTIYDEAAYDLSLDYSKSPPPPDLSPKEDEWLRHLLRDASNR